MRDDRIRGPQDLASLGLPVYEIAPSDQFPVMPYIKIVDGIGLIADRATNELILEINKESVVIPLDKADLAIALIKGGKEILR